MDSMNDGVRLVADAPYPLISGRTSDGDYLLGDALHEYLLLLRSQYYKLQLPSRCEIPFPFLFATSQRCDLCSLTFAKPSFLIDHCFSGGHMKMLSKHARGLSSHDMTILSTWIHNLEIYKESKSKNMKKL